MIKLRICGIELHFTFGFFLVIGLLSWFHSPSVGVMAVSACVIHELGHCLSAIILNVKITAIEFHCAGVLIKKENRIIPVFHELIILLCGPVFNILFAVIYTLGGQTDAAAVNAAFAFFNMLPWRSLDGGSVICLLLERRVRCAERVQKAVCLMLCAAIIFFMLMTGKGSLAALVTVLLLTLNETFL